MQQTSLDLLNHGAVRAAATALAEPTSPRVARDRGGVVASSARAFQFVRAWLGAQLAEQSPRGSIAALDGVRGLACLMVVGYHISLITHGRNLWSVSSNPVLSAILLNGGSGVMLFFVLSGFLLFMPYARALLFDQAWPNARQFYLRRALRILPGYYVSLVLLIMLANPGYLEPRNWGNLSLFVTMLMDSTPATIHAINGPYWTLALEWQFYLLLPLIAFGFYLLARRVRPARRVAVVAACLLVMVAWGLGTTVVGDYLQRFPTQTFLVPRGVLNVVLWFIYGAGSKYLQDFAFGMLASLIYIAATAPGATARLRQWMRRLSPVLWIAGLLVLVLLAMGHLVHEYGVTWPFMMDFFNLWSWAQVPGYPLAYALCIVAILFGSRWLTAFFAWAPLRWMGMISYALYIWHLPLLVAFNQYVGPLLVRLHHPLLAIGLYCVWAVVVVIPFALTIYLVVERPAMRLSARLRKPAVAAQRLAPTV